MSSASVTTSDGQVVVTSDDDAPPPMPAPPPPGVPHTAQIPDSFYYHWNNPLDPASLVLGIIIGMLMFRIIQRFGRLRARREARGHARAAAIGPQPEDRMAVEVAALAKRTATLETIVTDPAQRTAREIEALR